MPFANSYATIALLYADATDPPRGQSFCWTLMGGTDPPSTRTLSMPKTIGDDRYGGKTGTQAAAGGGRRPGRAGRSGLLADIGALRGGAGEVRSHHRGA